MKSGDMRILCLFEALEDAERHMICWGHDPDKFNYVLEKGWSDILELLNRYKDRVNYYTINPPINKGQKFRVLSLNQLVYKIHAHIHNPYS